MAETKYTYSISADTASSSLNAGALSKEISDSSIATSLNYVYSDGDVLDIYMADALSTGDETTLTAVVNAHTVPTFIEPNVAEAYEEQNYNNANNLTSIVYYSDNTKTRKIKEELVSYTGGKVSQVTTNEYDGYGLLLKTTVETITYAGNRVSNIDRSVTWQ